MRTFKLFTRPLERVIGKSRGLWDSIYYANRSSFMDPQVGDGVTINHYTDRSACTVIERHGSRVLIQRDNAKRLTKPEIVPGGFAGHCVNNHNIKYSYSRNYQGATHSFSRRKNGRWIRVGDKMKTGTEITMGRHEFYDYNF